VVDFLAREHRSAEYRKIYFRGQIPALRDASDPSPAQPFVLAESSVILRYLATKFNDKDFPADDIKQRARVNEVISFFNSGLFNQLAYHIAYPQTFNATLWNGNVGLARAEAEFSKPALLRDLNTLDSVWLKGRSFLLGGNKPSIADFFGWSVLNCGLFVNCEFSDYLNISRWHHAMTSLHTSAAIMAPTHAMIATNPFGSPHQFVNVRPVPGRVLHVVTATIKDEPAYRKWLADYIHVLRGVKGCLSVETGIDSSSQRAVIVRIWKDKASYVAGIVTAESRARFEQLVGALGGAVDPVWTSTVSSLVDL